MRKYFSLMEWRDNSDGHIYREGEPFPFDGREIPQDRLDELASKRNRAGLALIRADVTQDEAEEAPKKEAPEGAKKPRKTATAKRAKKTN